MRRRAIHLAKQFHRDFEPEFVAALRGGPEQRGQVPRRAGRLGAARPAERRRPGSRAGAPRHQPDLRPTTAGSARQRVYSFDLETIDHEVRSRGERPPGGRQPARPLAADLEPGRGPVRRRSTSAGWTSMPCSAKSRPSPESFEAFKAEAAGDLPHPARWPTSRAWSRGEFPGRAHRLDDLFRDEQRRIIGIILEDRFADYQTVVRAAGQPGRGDAQSAGAVELSDPQAAPRGRLDLSSTSTSATRSPGWSAARPPRSMPSSGSASEGEPGATSPSETSSRRPCRSRCSRLSKRSTPTADLTAITSRAEQLLAAAALLGLEPEPLAGPEPVPQCVHAD